MRKLPLFLFNYETLLKKNYVDNPRLKTIIWAAKIYITLSIGESRKKSKDGQSSHKEAL